MYFVYKFYDIDGNLLYIGKTTDLKRRISEHMRMQPWKGEIYSVHYAMCRSKTDMDLYELYYINFLKSKYNILSLNNDIPSVALQELSFFKFNLQEIVGVKRKKKTAHNRIRITNPPAEDSCKSKEKIEDSLTIALKTRYHNYNYTKSHIANQYATMNIQRVESTRHISNFLNIPKSIVSRAILQLEEDGFIRKISIGSHPKQNWYIVAISKQEALFYKYYHSLSRFKKKKFLNQLLNCNVKSIDDIEIDFKTLNLK